MTDVLKWISDNWVTILAMWGGVCVVIDGIVGLSSTKKDDEIWTKIKATVGNIINIFPKKK